MELLIWLMTAVRYILLENVYFCERQQVPGWAAEVNARTAGERVWFSESISCRQRTNDAKWRPMRSPANGKVLIERVRLISCRCVAAFIQRCTKCAPLSDRRRRWEHNNSTIIAQRLRPHSGHPADRGRPLRPVQRPRRPSVHSLAT